ncbi:MAG: phosphatidylglycerophosphatase A, partial [Alphaproteobacteria bacterium]
MNKNKPNKLTIYLATAGGIGRVPFAPGTWASIAALPFAVILHLFGGPWLLSISIVIIFFIG